MSLNIEHFGDALKRFLQEEFSDESLKISILDKKVDVKGKFCSLYIRFLPRFLPWDGETLVIASFSFYPTRQRHGKRFLDFLAANAEDFEYSNIGLENTSPKGLGTAFAHKYGFQELIPAHNVGENHIFYDMNWSIKVSDFLS